MLVVETNSVFSLVSVHETSIGNAFHNFGFDYPLPQVSKH